MLTSSPTFDEKTITDSSKVDSYKSTVCPIGSFDAPTSVDMSSLIKKAIMLDSGESSYPEKIPVTITEVSEEIPLHEGIQQFLQNPKLMLTQNLHALRDATIEALSLIINEISVRSNAPQSVGERRPAIINNEFLKRHYSHDESTSKRQKKDIQLALALLLKHKGGSGLGHGRLKDKDLDMLEEKLRKSVEYMRS